MKDPSSDTTSPSLMYVLIGPSLIGVINAVPIGVCLTVLNVVILHSILSLGGIAVLSVVTAVGSGMVWALIDRSLQIWIGTKVPQGLSASANYLVTPPVVGLATGLALTDPPTAEIVAVAAFLGSLPDAFIMQPWKRDHDPEEFDRKNAEFAEMTREFWSEYRDEVATKAARRTHERELRHQETVRPENRPVGPVRRRDLD
ncbi:hypothetical protein V5T10_10520 [Corynebacterium bovis]|uniref:hypothetical protein n=1 Tax=Corynebacterium bovis TaxID=36808 RepID=UPI000F64DA69|nr:hypothetical protein [Corynebacterium bovis]